MPATNSTETFESNNVKEQHNPTDVQLSAAAAEAYAPHSLPVADSHTQGKEVHSIPSVHISDPNEKSSLAPGDHRQMLSVDGKTRDFEVHVPPSYDASKPIPTIYMMGGVGGSIDQMKHETGMNRLADEKGFAVVYVEALPKDFPGTFGKMQSPSWNLEHGSLEQKVPGYDDLNYIKAVDGAVNKQLNTDKSAQYIAGFSEGGGAAQFVAESMPGTFAGVGSVHGTHLDSDPQPKAGDDMAFVAIHGDSDHMLPLDGGRGFMTITLDKAKQSKPLEQAPLWAKADDCSDPKVTDDGKDKTTEYVCKGAPVKEIIRHGGQHAWDGLGQNPQNYITHKPDFGWKLVGMPNPEENSSKDLWDALSRYKKPNGELKVSRSLEN